MPSLVQGEGIVAYYSTKFYIPLTNFESWYDIGLVVSEEVY